MVGTLAGRLGPLSALAEDGQPVRLGTQWAVRAAVVVFVRHFG